MYVDYDLANNVITLHEGYYSADDMQLNGYIDGVLYTLTYWCYGDAGSEQLKHTIEIFADKFGYGLNDIEALLPSVLARTPEHMQDVERTAVFIPTACVVQVVFDHNN